MIPLNPYRRGPAGLAVLLASLMLLVVAMVPAGSLAAAVPPSATANDAALVSAPGSATAPLAAPATGDALLAPSPSPWVTTDGLDYSPGQVVTITGGEWQPGEAVTLVIHEDPPVHPDTILQAVASDVGAFSNADFVIQPDHVGVAFTLTATGSSGAVATTIFSDALSDFYRTRQSGAWSDVNTWESSATVGGTYALATTPPTSASNAITIRTGHVVTVSANATADQVTIAAGGQVTINSGVTFTLNNGTGSDVTVNGTLSVNGTVSMPASSTVTVSGTMSIGATGLLDGQGSSAANRPVFNVASGGSLTVANGGSMTTTGSGRMSVTIAAGGTATIDGIISGTDTLTVNGSLTASSSITMGGTSSLQVGGNLTMTAGTLTAQRGNSGTVGSINSGGTIMLGGGSVLSIGTVAGASLTVASGGTLDVGPSAVVSGAGLIAVAAGAGLRIGSVDGITTGTTLGNIRTTATDTYSTTANYTYKGTAAQITGNALPATVNNLTINNAGGANVTLAASVTVSGVLTLTSGDLLTTASFTVTQPTTGSSAGVTDVVGTVIRTGFVSGGAARSFGNPNTSITISSGTVPTQVSITLAKATPPTPVFPSAVARTWTIAATGGSGISAIVQLHYLDGELNGSTDSTLHLWKVVAAAWADQDPTGATTTRNTTASDADATNNQVRMTGVTSLASAAWAVSNRAPGTSVNNVTFGSSVDTPLISSALAMTAWTVGFTTSSAGALAAGDTITVTFDAAFSISAQSFIPATGLSNCARSATAVGTVVTITLSNQGGTCAVAASTAVTLGVSIVTNPAAGTYAASGFKVRTSKDTADASTPSPVVIAAGTSVGAVTFSGTPLAAGSRSAWTVAFTASGSGALAAGDTITITLPTGFGAHPDVTFGGAFSNCFNDGGRTLGSLIRIRLGNNGGTCALAAGASGSVRIDALTNPAAGSYPATGLSVGTSKDPVATHPSGAQAIAAATAPAAVTLAGSPAAASARATWTAGFTTSSSGALGAGDQVTVVLNPGFAAPAVPVVTLAGGFAGCRVTGAGSGSTVVATLANNGATCTLPASTAGQVIVRDILAPVAGSYAAATFSVATTRDTTAASPASAVVIAASSATTGVTLAGSPATGGALATWSAGFTTSAAGALAAGDTVAIRLGDGFTLPSAPVVTLAGGFSACAATGVVVGQALTATLANSGGTCALAALSAGIVRVAAVANPAAGTYAASGFGVATSKNLASVSPVAAVTIGAATVPGAVSFAGSPLAHGVLATWTVGFTTSATGALGRDDQVVVTFDPAFTQLAWGVTLGPAFANCARTASVAANTVTITLRDGTGTCSVAATTAVALTIAGVTNPASASYPAAGFGVRTTKDTTTGHPTGAVVIN